MAICKTWPSVGPLLRLTALPCTTAPLSHLSPPLFSSHHSFYTLPSLSLLFHFHTSCALCILDYIPLSACLCPSVVLSLSLIYPAHVISILYYLYLFFFCPLFLLRSHYLLHLTLLHFSNDFLRISIGFHAHVVINCLFLAIQYWYVHKDAATVESFTVNCILHELLLLVLFTRGSGWE